VRACAACTWRWCLRRAARRRAARCAPRRARWSCRPRWSTWKSCSCWIRRATWWSTLPAWARWARRRCGARSCCYRGRRRRRRRPRRWPTRCRQAPARRGCRIASGAVMACSAVPRCPLARGGLATLRRACVACSAEARRRASTIGWRAVGRMHCSPSLWGVDLASTISLLAEARKTASHAISSARRATSRSARTAAARTSRLRAGASAHASARTRCRTRRPSLKLARGRRPRGCRAGRPSGSCTSGCGQALGPSSCAWAAAERAPRAHAGRAARAGAAVRAASRC